MKTLVRGILATIAAVIVLSAGEAARAQSPFTKVFSPNTIGPGGVSTLTFTIDNTGSAIAANNLAFVDVLPVVPGAVEIVGGTAAHTCGAGTLTAPDGGGTITFSGGQVGAGAICTVTVKVTASTPGVHTNTTGDLTSSAGNSGTATDDLTVDTGLPGFTKSFAPSSVSLGAKSTLTYVIDNSANASNVLNLDFTETLPSGLEIASPANSSTTCGTALIPPTLTATAGGTTIALDANGTGGFPAVAGSATCTVTVDVLTTGAGMLTATSGPLLANFVDAGASSATLDVTVTALNIQKAFSDDPTPPGSNTTLEFRLDNFNRLDAATGVAFTDDLTSFVPTLTGVTFASLLTNDCGGSVSGVGTNNIGFSGGTIAPEGFCTIRVSLSVPGGATPGSYTNTTSAITGTVGGIAVTGNTATDDLLVSPGGVGLPLVLEVLDAVTKAPNPTPSAGDDIALRFTISNSSTTSMATDLEALLDLIPPMPFPVTVTLPPTPNPPCGAGSSLALISTGSDDQGLELTNGSLAAAPSAAASCTFDVVLTLPSDLPGGTYTFVSDAPTATIDGATRVGVGGSDSVTVSGGLNLSLSKSFDSAAAPGGTVNLTFDILKGPDSPNATGINFTDLLDAMGIAGLTATLPPTADTCGGSFGPSTTNLSYSGGSLSTASCAITVAVDVPAGAATGSYTNTTSKLFATPSGGSTEFEFDPASADLVVAGIVFTKEFLPSTVIAGATTTLRFSIQNQSPTDDATITFFTDNLQASLTGLAVDGPATVNTCGGTLSGTTFLTYIGGAVNSGLTCTIEVPVLVPPGSGDGTYSNVTSSLSAVLGGSSVTAAPAQAELTVQSLQLSLAKTFTDSPTSPGGTATMQLTLENLNATSAVTGIAFTDDLDAMLLGTVPTGLPLSACGGTVSDAGSGVVDFTGGSLAAGATCNFLVTMDIPGGATDATVTNTTSGVTGNIGGLPVTADPASAELDVSSVGTQYTASFSPSPVFPGDTSTLSIKIVNPNAGTVTGLGFVADLDAMLSGLTATTLPTDPCGVGSSITGTSALTFSGGEVAGSNAECNFDVVVTVPLTAPAGTFPFQSSDLTAGGVFSASLTPGAELQVVPAVDISVTKSDGVTTATPGGSVVYSIVVANAGPSTDPSVSLTDSFPAGLTCTYTSTASGGATGNSAAGSGDLSETLSMPASSSVTYTANCAIPSSATGTLSNTASASPSATDTNDGNNVATDSDTVLAPEADLSVSKTDSVTSVAGGGSLTYAITVANAGPSDSPVVTLVDNFPTGLTCTYTAAASGGASGETVSGSDDLSEVLSMPAGSSVAYSATCTVDPSATGTLSNTASVSGSVTDPVPGNNSATDGDTVIVPEADLSVTKTDGVTSVVAGQSLTYTIVAANAGPSTDPSVSLLDTLPADLTCNFTSVAGGGATGNSATGSGDLTEALSMPPGSSATYTVGCVVDPAATGTLSNTASVSSSVTDPAPGNNSATDADTAISAEADLSITKDDGVTSVEAGLTLTYTITAANAGPSADPAVSIADNFPTELTGCNYTAVASGGAAGFTASGSGNINEAGTVSMPVGSSVTYTAICTVDPAATGTLSNTANITASVTDPAPGNNSATDGNTTVSPIDLVFTKMFAPDVVEQGQETALTFTINNTANAIAATSLAFTDDLSALGLVITDAPIVNGCNGTISGGSGDQIVSLASGSVPANTSCEITVTLRADSPGLKNNLTTDLTSNLPTVAGAADDLTVSAPVSPTLTKTLSSTDVEEGEAITMTLVVANPNNFLPATSVALQDVMTGNLVVSTAAAGDAGCDGTVTGAIGDEIVSFNGTIAPATICTVTVGLTVTAQADFDNTATLRTSLGDTLDTVSVTVTPAVTPTLTKTLSATSVDEGEAITMTLEIENPNTFLPATSVSLLDDMTGTLAVSTAATGSPGCVGTVSGGIGDVLVSFTGSIAPLTTCTINVGLTVTAGDNFTNTATMTSSLGDTSDSVSVTVTPAPPLTLAMAFVPVEIEQTQSSTLTYTFTNTSLLLATSISLSDTLPANVVIASPEVKSKTCTGGMVSAPAGGSVIDYSGGELPAGQSCSISVDVTSSAVGTYPNASETQTSSLGTSAAASDTLRVVPATTGTLTIVQNTDQDGAYVFSSSETNLNFTINTSGGTGSAGPIALPLGAYLIAQSPPAGVGNTAISCDDGNSSGDPVARTLSVNIEGLEAVTCTITSISTLQKTVDTINRFLTKRADLILSSEPRSDRRFNRLKNGSGNSSPLTFSTGDLKSLLPFTAEISRGSNEYRFSTSLLQVRQAAASVALAHGSTKDVVHVENYRFDAWFEAQYKKFDADAQGEGHFAIAYLGADYLLTPDMLVGIMLQVDDMEDVSTVLNTTARGTGWMVGPYMTARLGPNLYFDGRIAAGRSNNEVSPFNTYVDDFETTRWMAMASLTGEYQYGPWTVRPNASLSYFEETQKSYVDSLAVTIPSQTVTLGQFKIGPTFTGRFETDGGLMYSPYFGFDAIYNLGSTTGVTLTNPDTPATKGWRGRFAAGIDMITKGGTKLSFGGTYDGLFRSDFESWGVAVEVSIPLKKAKSR